MILALSILILIFILLYIQKISKEVSGFPVFYDIWWLMRHGMSWKNDTSFTRLLFQCIEEMYKKHAKDGLCMAYHTGPFLYIFSEEPAKIFLNEKFAIDKPKEYKILSDGIGNGLITSNGDRWKKHRKLVSPAFQMSKLKLKVTLFNEHAFTLIEDLKSLEKHVSSDYLPVIQQHYFYSLCESVFGMELSKENKTQFLKYLEALERAIYMGMYRVYLPWLWFKPLLYLFSSGRKYLMGCEKMNSFVKNVVLEMKKCVDSNENLSSTGYFSERMHESLAYILLQHHTMDPSFTLEDVHSHVNTFIAAGYDTVSHATIWCLYMMGLYPEFQEKAYQEVKSESDVYISYEEMKSFAFLEAFIMETLRLYPPVPIILRMLNENVEFGKYKVQKGTRIGFPIYFYHRNPDIYPDPETFDPNRFLNSKQRKPWMHIPFGEGNRVCLGKNYALLEMKIFLAHILRNFEIISLNKREDLEICFSIVLTQVKPLLIQLKPRSKD